MERVKNFLHLYDMKVDMTIDLNPSCDRSLAEIKPTGKDGIKWRICTLCLKQFHDKDFICSPERSSLDIQWVCCLKCFNGKKKGEHFRFVLYRHPSGTRDSFPSFALTARSRFLAYAENQCIGRYDREEKKFLFKSYGEVYRDARRLQSALISILGESEDTYVAIRCSNYDFSKKKEN